MAARELHPVQFFDDRDAGDVSVESIKDFRPRYEDLRKAEVMVPAVEIEAEVEPSAYDSSINHRTIVSSLVAFAGTASKSGSKRTAAKD